MKDENKKESCEDCKYYLDDYWDCQGEENICHEFILRSDLNE